MTRPRVYVTRRIPAEGLEAMRAIAAVEVWSGELPPGKGVITGKVRDAEGLVSLVTDPIDAEVLACAPKLKVIANYAVGVDNIDLEEATSRGVYVTNTPEVLTETTADFAFALLMSTARRVVEGHRYVQQGLWKTWGPTLLLGQDVYGSTLGLVGMGRIGLAVARRARGFNMRVLYHNRRRNERAEQELGVEYAGFDDLLRQSDFVSIHVPLTPQTRNLFSTEEFELMKETAILINTARGPIVDCEALYKALVNKEIAGAGLDVTDPEPITGAHPLLTVDNVVIAPHIASASVKTRTKMAMMVAENIKAVFTGRIPPNLVNRKVLAR